MTGTAGYNVYWSDANTLGYEQYASVTRGGTGGGTFSSGGVLYGNGTSALGVTAAGTNGQILTSNGTAPVWSSSLADSQISDTLTISSSGSVDAGAIKSGTLVVARGGTGATTLTGVLKGNGTSAFTAMTGTANYTARWTDANTLGTGALYDNGTNVGVGVTSPAAALHLKAGTASANTAPLKFTSGTNLTTPEAGAMEYDGTNLYFTPGAARKTIAYVDSNISGTSSNVTGVVAVTNGGTGATTLTGVLKGNGTSAFTAMTGTANYTARWTDANTLGTGAL